MLTCGFAGGLNPALVRRRRAFSTPAIADLRSQVDGGGRAAGKFYCASRIATTAAEKAELRRTTGADAVEMESEAFAQLCRERGFACATVRVISDTAHDDLPLDFNQLSQPDLSLDYGKLAWTVAKSPGENSGAAAPAEEFQRRGERSLARKVRAAE